MSTTIARRSGPSVVSRKAVDLVNDGSSLVLVHAGTYAENVTVNKSTTLGGEGPTTIIAPAGGTGIDVIAGSIVNLQNLRITGATNAINANGLTSLSLTSLTLTGNTSGGTLNNVDTVHLVTDSGVVDETVTVTPTQFSVQGQNAIAYTGVDLLTVFTVAGNDTINVTPSVTTAIRVDGGTGNDSLIVNQNGLGATITPSQVLVSGRKPVDYFNIESVSAPRR